MTRGLTRINARATMALAIRPAQRVVLIAFFAVATLAAPEAAFAHANLVQTVPANRAVLVRAPARVVVRFDDDVRVAPGNAAIRNGDGPILRGKPSARGRTLVLPLRGGL